MDAPYYSVLVKSDTEGWTYTYTHGDEPDPDVDVHLADPLTYVWAFESGVVPGQLVPVAATVNLWCRDAASVPAIQLGDFIQVQVNIGASGPMVIAPPSMRVSACEVTLTPNEAGDDFAADVAITVVDTLAELRGMFISRPLGNAGFTHAGITYGPSTHAREYWRPRLAELAVLIDRSIGCPTWWSNDEQPHPGTWDGVTSTTGYQGLAFVGRSEGNWDGKQAHELITQLLNSHQPGGVTHTIVPWNDSSYPTGYEKVAPTGTVYGADAPRPVPADPDTALRYLLVPTSRVEHAHGVIELDADWCRVPAKARRSREHVVNTLKMGGRAPIANPADPNLVYKVTDTAVDFKNATDAAAHGVSGRNLPTALNLYIEPTNNPLTYAAVAPGVVAPQFLTDASARDAGWTYESFQIVSSLIPQATAEALLPVIAPRFPDELDGDGQVLRHVTLTNLDPSVQFGSDDVTGFITAGALTIADGEMTWSLALTPGDPQ